MTLRERLIDRIGRVGPMSVADYMTACLHDPEGGYYATRPNLGETGDFITAPLVSQMFGEMLGLWSAAVWEQMGGPPRVRLVELGPGDGTLMSDVLRASSAAPAFREACEIWLVETSAPLRDRQAARLAGAYVRWASDLSEIPADAPMIVLSNELLDCLPISQMVNVESAWVERKVGVDRDGKLAFVLDTPAETAHALVHEHSVALTDYARQVGRLIARAGGAALFIDYGREAPGYGDTLQALRRHEKEHPLAHPGEADLTAHVDFPAFAAAAATTGIAAGPIRRQGDFLRALGIEARAAALARARPERADLIGRQLERLIGTDQMGDLFKVVCLHSPGLAPPGFEP